MRVYLCLLLSGLTCNWLYAFIYAYNLAHRHNFDIQYYYRPQTKFAKVTFSQMFVCPQGGLHPRGSASRGSLHHWGSASWGFYNRGDGQTSPPLDTTGYGQQAGGMHPTGMHCYISSSDCAWNRVFNNKQSWQY